MKLPLRSRPGRRLYSIALAICLAPITSVCALAGSCKLGRIVEFPITMMNLRPLMSAKINDNEVHFLLDSGAFYSIISQASGL
jgi:hypothetical protein